MPKRYAREFRRSVGARLVLQVSRPTARPPRGVYRPELHVRSLLIGSACAALRTPR